MSIALAIGRTLLIFIITGVISGVVHFPLTLLLPLATACWAAFESARFRKRLLADEILSRDRDAIALLQTSRPMVVFTFCLVYWFLGLPWYLVQREKLKAMVAILPSSESGYPSQVNS